MCGSVLSISNKNSLSDECKRIEQRFKDDLEAFAVSENEQATLLEQITLKMETPLRVLGYAGQGFVILYNYFKNRIVQGDQKQHFDKFKREIDLILYEYIKTDLIAGENTLTAVTHRHSRVLAVVSH